MITREELSALSVSEVRGIELPGPGELDAFLELLTADPRRGVQNWGMTLKKRLIREQKERNRIQGMKSLEDDLRAAGYNRICGIDEVGRGPLAGPVVTCGVILPQESSIPGVNDSKKLSHKKRAELADRLQREAVAYAYGVMTPEHIDSMNILNATRHAMVSAAARLDPQPDLLLIDAVQINTDIPVRAVIHGDALCYSIAAASILAKEFRDDYMRKIASEYPEYGFDRNMGYGTEEHIEAIHKYGLCPIHRKSFCTKFV
ncbi:MAG: ribonuclease HII [Eubacteriaceae bacterium]|jgi:ribonuclease HII